MSGCGRRWRWRPRATAVAVAAVDAARPGAAPAETRVWRPPARRLPPILYENVVFYLLWVIESVIVLAKLCFFLRFGFRL